MKSELKNKGILAIKILFFVVLIFDMYALIIENKAMEMIFKPLLMILIISIYSITAVRHHFVFIIALIFSFLGDVFLLFGKTYFVLGLLSFLLTHLLYIKLITKFVKKTNITTYFKNALPFVLFFLVIISTISKNTENLLLPVILYGIIISAFGTVTLLNYTQKRNSNNKLLLIGAILFILSDAVLAIAEFYLHNTLLHVFNITLYGVSQYLICEAILRIDD